MFDDHAFRAALPPDEEAALRTYKQADAQDGSKDYAAWLNGFLLAGKAVPAEATPVVAGLDRATRRFRLPAPATLYRATFDMVMKAYAEAAAFAYPAYMSVSRSDTALAHLFSPERDDCTGVLLRIRCPAGAPMALVEWTHPPDGTDEAECLLPRGARFTVASRRPGSRDELLHYAGPECAPRLRGLHVWDLDYEP